MARMNQQQNTQQAAAPASFPYFATATIKGAVAGYYDKGKKYDYVTVDVPHSYDEYYDRFKIAVSKSWPCPDDGAIVELQCNIKAYKGDVTFKEINADTQ